MLNNGVLGIVSSIKEVSRATSNTAAKGNSSKSSDSASDTKDFKEVFNKATKENNSSNTDKMNSKEKINSNSEEMNTKEKTITKEENISTDEELEEGKDEEAINSLMTLLQGLLNGENNLDPKILEQLPEELKGEFVEAIKASIEKFISGDMNLDKLQGLNDNLKKDMNDILQLLEKNLNSEDISGKSLEDILSKINESDSSGDLKKEILNVLKEKLVNDEAAKTLKAENGNGQRMKDFNKIVNEALNKQNTVVKVNENESDGKNPNNQLNNSSEDKLLKELASGNKNDTNPKFDKVMNLMNSFNKVENSNPVVENTETMVVNKNTFVNDMIKSVKFMELNNMKEMTVKIMPKELGEVVIRLTMESGLMKASITAQNKEAYNLLNSNLQELNDKFGGEIKIQNFTIDIYNGDTTFFSNEKNRQQNEGQPSSKGKNSGVSVNEEEVQNIEHKKAIDNSNVNAFA